ncbi:MAG: hypothetical protein MHPSP_000526, partial [Paramarteilia canceri]
KEKISKEVVALSSSASAAVGQSTLHNTSHSSSFKSTNTINSEHIVKSKKLPHLIETTGRMKSSFAEKNLMNGSTTDEDWCLGDIISSIKTDVKNKSLKDKSNSQLDSSLAGQKTHHENSATSYDQRSYSSNSNECSFGFIENIDEILSAISFRDTKLTPLIKKDSTNLKKENLDTNVRNSIKDHPVKRSQSSSVITNESKRPKLESLPDVKRILEEKTSENKPSFFSTKTYSEKSVDIKNLLNNVIIPDMTIEKFYETAKNFKHSITQFPGKIDKWVQALNSAINFCQCAYRLETCGSPKSYRVYKDTLSMFSPLVSGISGGKYEDEASEIILSALSYLVKSTISLRIYKTRRQNLISLQKKVDAFLKKQDNNLKSEDLDSFGSTCSSVVTSENCSSNEEVIGANGSIFLSKSSSDNSKIKNINIPLDVFTNLCELNYNQHFLSQASVWWEKYENILLKLSAFSKVPDSASAKALEILSYFTFHSMTINLLYSSTTAILKII